MLVCRYTGTIILNRREQMLITHEQMRREERSQMRGGTGTTALYHALEAEPVHHMRLLGEICLPPGASIGSHAHEGEREYFFFHQGRGRVNDNGVEKTVKPGDIMVTGEGASHSVSNTGSEELAFFAIIITEC
jgi:mannose-6-phosphate isomerase-like protein (cupin superfamily)